jgi:hypothetical protein
MTRWLPAAATLLALLAPAGAHAHAIAGQRVFPSTLTFDDPGIGAEMPLVFSHINVDGVQQNDLNLSLTKPITPNFSLTLGTDYFGATGGGDPAVHGWDNVTLGGVWQAYVNPATESIGALGLSRTFAGTGSQAVRADYSTWSSEFKFGQGLGGLKTDWLRPIAVTGAVGVDLPDDSSVPRTLNWALSLQYSIPYLQNFVKYAGIKAPFDRMIPLVEFPMQTCLDRGCSGQTTGYVAPGVAWVGHDFQVAAALQIPINRRTGNSVGFLLQFDFYLDDLVPHGFGAPLFK